MSKLPPGLRAHAPAKINLNLRVLSGRADGYHELRTTFQSLALHDTLTFTRTNRDFSIAADDPRCPANSSNLVWKAADALWREAGRRGQPSGVRVRIAKRIPLQAGLGGGSSNGAAALRVLSALWGVRDGKVLHEIARSLGADVPFFLEGGTVLGLERGDLLFPLIDRPPAWVVLVVPPFGVSTRDAYSWWDEAGNRPGPGGAASSNDLEAPVVARHREIAVIIKRLRRLGASDASMSGSGSVVFGLFGQEGQARRAASRLLSAQRTVIVTKTITRRQYQVLAGPR